MAEGGSSSSSGAAGAGTSGATSGAAPGTSQAQSTVDTGAVNDDSKVSQDNSDSKKAVVDAEPVTVKEVKDKSTIDTDHVEGDKKEKYIEIKKHKYHDRLSKAYPGKEFSNDDDYENTHEEYVKNLEGYKERGVIANQKLIEYFESNPEIADIVSSGIKGESVRAGLARHFSAEDLTAEKGDPDFDVWEKNSKERQERLANRQKFEQEFEQNLEFSTKAIQEFADENKLKPEEAEKILGEFDEMLKDVYKGRFTKETLNKIMRAVKHDEAVQAAREEGEIKGKNEKIEAVREKTSDQGDGLPVVKKSGEETEKEPEEESVEVSFINRLEKINKKRSNF